MEGRAQGDIRSYVEEIIDPAETFKDDVKNGDLREDNRYEFADDFEKGWQKSTGESTGVERGELAEYFEELIVEDQKSAESEV